MASSQYTAITTDHGPEVYHGRPRPVPAPYNPKESPVTGVAAISSRWSDHKAFGPSTLALVIIAALTSGVIVGAAVGGGLGAELASCQKGARVQSSPSSPSFTSSVPSSFLPMTISSATNGAVTSATSSVTSTTASSTSSGSYQNYTPVPARSVDTTAFNCPAINGTTYTTHTNNRYLIYCGVDMWGGLASNENPNSPIADLVNTIAYTVDDCIEACGAFNGNSGAWQRNLYCRGITYRRMLGSQTTNYGGNCWLKNGTLPDGQVGGAGASWSGIAAADVLSAKIDPASL